MISSGIEEHFILTRAEFDATGPSLAENLSTPPRLHIADLSRLVSHHTLLHPTPELCFLGVRGRSVEAVVTNG